jgi:hypothetical protein
VVGTTTAESALNGAAFNPSGESDRVLLEQGAILSLKDIPVRRKKYSKPADKSIVSRPARQEKNNLKEREGPCVAC